MTKEYQMTIFDGIDIEKIKKKMVNPPAPPKEDDNDTLVAVTATRYKGFKRVPCEMCVWTPNEAKYLVCAKFSITGAVDYFMCISCKDRFLRSFTPFLPFLDPSSNTGTTLLLQPFEQGVLEHGISNHSESGNE